MPAVQVAWRPTPRIASQLRAFLHPSAPRTCPRVGFERSRTRTSRVQAELPARFDFSVTQAGTVSTRWRRCKSICFLRTWPHFCGHSERKQDHAASGETLPAACRGGGGSDRSKSQVGSSPAPRPAASSCGRGDGRGGHSQTRGTPQQWSSSSCSIRSEPSAASCEARPSRGWRAMAQASARSESSGLHTVARMSCKLAKETRVTWGALLWTYVGETRVISCV